MPKATNTTIWIPETPGGSVLAHLEAKTEEQAWLNLLEDAKHMPYPDRKAFKDRGYAVYSYTAAEETTDE